MYHDNLKRLLREEVACHDAMLSSTPHLSKIRHAAAHLLSLLETPDRPPSSDDCPPTVRASSRPGMPASKAT